MCDTYGMHSVFVLVILTCSKDNNRSLQWGAGSLSIFFPSNGEMGEWLQPDQVVAFVNQ